MDRFNCNTNQADKQPSHGNVDDLTNRLNQLDVNTMMDVQTTISPSRNDNSPFQETHFDDMSQINQYFNDTMSIEYGQQHHQQQQQPQIDKKQSNILIVTNLDSSVFIDRLVKAKFESLFTAYDKNVTFRYLKSFRRVRLDFTSSQLAEMARINLNDYKLGNTTFKCYLAQIIRPNNANSLDDSQDGGDYNSNAYLSIPKPTKQFLISPPASPPVGWEPVNESTPCIDVQLISAIANLVPGKVHEIHAGNESQPGIFVEVCEEVQFDRAQQTTRPRIPKTASPNIANHTACYQMES